MKTWNFGILAPGNIAHKFVAAFGHTPRARAFAVASRDSQLAKAFAQANNMERAYASYADLSRDPDVDIVYIAAPHVVHHPLALQCLREGKAVLCEKPLAINLKQVKEMTAAAKAANVFLMEGMWSRFFPYLKKTLELISSGAIGEVKYIQADFGFSAPVNFDGRIYNLALGGGAQLDVGVYPLFLILGILGKPDEIKAHSNLAVTGADATTGAILYYKRGVIAQLSSSIVADSPKEAHIVGTTGTIKIHGPWYKSQHLTLRLNSGEITEFPFPYPGNGFQFEIEEVVNCLDEKKTECPLMTHAFSVMMAEVSDEIRRQGGVKYAVD